MADKRFLKAYHEVMGGYTDYEWSVLPSKTRVDALYQALRRIDRREVMAGHGTAQSCAQWNSMLFDDQVRVLH